MLLILDNTSPRALAVDPALPPSAAAVHDALLVDWPRLTGRVMRPAAFAALHGLTHGRTPRSRSATMRSVMRA